MSSPVLGWQLLGAVVTQSWLFVCLQWSQCSRCMCLSGRPHICMCCSQMRLDLLTLECVLGMRGLDRVRYTSWLSVSSYWWVKRWAWFQRRPGQLLDQTVTGTWPSKQCNLISAHLHLTYSTPVASMNSMSRQLFWFSVRLMYFAVHWFCFLVFSGFFKSLRIYLLTFFVYWKI